MIFSTALPISNSANASGRSTAEASRGPLTSPGCRSGSPPRLPRHSTPRSPGAAVTASAAFNGEGRRSFLAAPSCGDVKHNPPGQLQKSLMDKSPLTKRRSKVAVFPAQPLTVPTPPNHPPPSKSGNAQHSILLQTKNNPVLSPTQPVDPDVSATPLLQTRNILDKLDFWQLAARNAPTTYTNDLRSRPKALAGSARPSKAVLTPLGDGQTLLQPGPDRRVLSPAAWAEARSPTGDPGVMEEALPRICTAPRNASAYGKLPTAQDGLRAKWQGIAALPPAERVLFFLRRSSAKRGQSASASSERTGPGRERQKLKWGI